ncbi:phosphotransferase enzyme family protein [Sarocladium implicatum]|nr:phosphotransferase enzyme family protein [Sarocladium implicatum]
MEVAPPSTSDSSRVLSFNFSFRYRLSDDGPDAIVRFPKPGHTAAAMRDEKVVNEVQAMSYLSQKTAIPFPRILSWGLTCERPEQLGPFIIMDSVEGTLLSDLLKQPAEGDGDIMVLSPNADKLLPDEFYRQIADYLLQLSQLAFPCIGALSEENGGWVVTKRPRAQTCGSSASLSKTSAKKLAEAAAVEEGKQLAEPPLSARMRESWSSGRFWFDHAARKSFDVDTVYSAALHDEGNGTDLLDAKTCSEIEPFVEEKVKQLKAYKDECTA